LDCENLATSAASSTELVEVFTLFFCKCGFTRITGQGRSLRGPCGLSPSLKRDFRCFPAGGTPNAATIESPSQETAGLGPLAEPKKKVRWQDSLRFYLTAIFTLVACISSFAFLFLVPFVIDPAFSTIFADFDPEPVICVTKESEFFFGLSNCSWSSCREGCTRDIFQCSHIYVNYKKDTKGEFKNVNFTDVDRLDDIKWDLEDARLFPNVKGCGYPPSVNCTIFNMSYSTPGRTYPCYYSKEQPTTVLTSLDIEGITTDLIYAIVIPWGAFLVSILYLLITYVGMRKPDSDGDAPQEVTSAKASKEASNYSLRSIGKTINHGMNKLMGEPDDKGGRGGGEGLKQRTLTSPSMLGSNLLLVPASLPQVHPNRRSTLPPLERTPPLPRPAR
ncbi:protein tipE-like, partial [Penaeus japonicus]|uniref:protein tipE-like n=1 Tax=Penaeus japonicus TaxID=27405 RepID=UPI001C70BE68